MRVEYHGGGGTEASECGTTRYQIRPDGMTLALTFDAERAAPASTPLTSAPIPGPIAGEGCSSSCLHGAWCMVRSFWPWARRERPH